jgi:FMN phosphatase YigB (HAD superfamily)
MSRIPVFDIGDTLIPVRKNFQQCVRLELESNGFEDPPEYPILENQKINPDHIEEWAESEGLEADVERVINRVMVRLGEEVRERRVKEFLEGVGAETAKPGIVSDGSKEHREFLADLLGIEERVNGFVMSGEVGVEKPAPEIFREFLARRGVEGQECVYFGNNARRDAGAQEVGMEFVQVTGIDTYGTEWNGRKIEKLSLEKVKMICNE